MDLLLLSATILPVECWESIPEPVSPVRWIDWLYNPLLPGNSELIIFNLYDFY